MKLLLTNPGTPRPRFPSPGWCAVIQPTLLARTRGSSSIVASLALAFQFHEGKFIGIAESFTAHRRSSVRQFETQNDLTQQILCGLPTSPPSRYSTCATPLQVPSLPGGIVFFAGGKRGNSGGSGCPATSAGGGGAATSVTRETSCPGSSGSGDSVSSTVAGRSPVVSAKSSCISRPADGDC